jgi:hypothetical protein
MDHKTNAALYLLAPGADQVRCLGDARSASESAGNRMQGETFQKFHTRPLEHGGQVYVASLNYSDIADGYKKERGSHLYCYDPRSQLYDDLSARYPHGVAVETSGLVALAGAASNDRIVGMTAPDANLVLLDIKSFTSKILGRPRAFDRGPLYAGRVLWRDRDDRVYFTAGNPFWGSYDPAIYGFVHYYDLRQNQFGERRDWPLNECRAIETCQWASDQRRCFLADDVGTFYVFDNEQISFHKIGAIPCKPDERIWVFHLLEELQTAFFVSSTLNRKAAEPALYRFDLRTNVGKRICYLREIHPDFGDLDFFTGYDALDLDRRFYFTSFSSQSDQRLILNRIDPRCL